MGHVPSSVPTKLGPLTMGLPEGKWKEALVGDRSLIGVDPFLQGLALPSALPLPGKATEYQADLHLGTDWGRMHPLCPSRCWLQEGLSLTNSICLCPALSGSWGLERVEALQLPAASRAFQHPWDSVGLLGLVEFLLK